MTRVRLFVLVFLLVICGCDRTSKAVSAEVSEAFYDNSWNGASQLMPKNLFYVVSPSDAYITEFGFGFGREIKRGDTLMVLSDPKIHDEFVEAIIGYLKSRDKLMHEQNKMKGEEEMLKAGILSEDEYWSQKSTHQDHYISYLKDKLRLQEISKLVGVKYSEIAKIKISNLDVIEKLILGKVSVKILAPYAGLLLPRSIASNDDDKPLTLGQKVDRGELIAAIAEQGTYKVKVFLPGEFSRKINFSAKVIVKNDLGLLLDAKVIDFQPYLYEIKNGNKFFPVTLEIIMPKPPLKIPDVYIGMPVNVQILLNRHKYKVIPIQAIGYHEGKYFVEKQNLLGVEKVSVDVVGTDANKVYFRGNIAVGDKVILHD